MLRRGWSLIVLASACLVLWACGGGEPRPRDVVEGDPAPADSRPADVRDEADVSAVEALEPEPDVAVEDLPDVPSAEPVEPQDAPPGETAPDTPSDADVEAGVDACACSAEGDCPPPVLPCRRAACVDCACVELEVDQGPCNDGDACTTDDSCAAGVCLGVPLTCDDANPCTADTCSPAGACVHEPLTTEAGCDDGDVCTVGDRCVEGTCTPGEDRTRRSRGEGGCDDGEVCTLDACDPVEGCVHAPLAGPCDDDDACTSSDACVDGACVGLPVSCDDGEACTADGCSPLLGCFHSGLDGGPCTDGSVCTTDDRCTAGACRGQPLPCDDHNVCTADLCDPGLGCLNPARAGACDDGSSCTRDDACVGSTCVGAPLPCDDGNPCTDDACEEGLGCRHAPNEAPCDDLGACTTGDRCQASECRGTPVPCEDPPPPICTEGGASALVYTWPGVCVEGQCTYASVEHGCAGGCLDGRCLGDPCAGVACGSPPSPCFHAMGTCVDGACRYDPADGVPCDDGNPCTRGDACLQGVCAGTPAWCVEPPPATCVDGATRRAWLTGGTCHPADGGCTYAHVDETCPAGCAGGLCLVTPGLRGSELTAFGGALGSSLYDLRAVSTPWPDGDVTSSATWNLTMGFEP